MKAFKDTVRKYYKYGSQPNVTFNGSPTIVDGVASGFSSNDWLKITRHFATGSSNWEMVIKITTGAVGGSQGIVTSLDSADGAVELFIGNIFTIGLSGTYVSGTYNTLPNTTYWLKLYFTGTQYKLDYSLDGVTYINNITLTRSTYIQQNATLALGIDYAGGTSFPSPFLGSIDLKESYINVDGQQLMPLGYWWHGTLPEECTQAEAEWYEDELKYYVINQ